MMLRVVCEPRKGRQTAVGHKSTKTMAPRAILALGLSVALAVGALVGVTTSATSASAAAALLCDQNTLYGINSSGQVDAINATTGGVTTLTSMPSANNGLGLAQNGVDAYAFDNGGNTLSRYNASSGLVTSVANVDPNGTQTVIRGAVNPVTGIYYYGASGASAYLGAYNTAGNAEIGKVGTINGLSSTLNGDFAFSQTGQLFVVSGNEILRVNVTTIPSTAGNTALTTSLVATLPGSTNSPGIAFTSNGYLYVSTGSTIIQLDPSSGLQIGSTIAVGGGFTPTDLASCNYPNTVSTRTSVSGRVNSTDQFTLSVSGDGLPTGGGNSATTTGTATGVQAAIAGAALAVPSQTYTVAEAASGTTDFANYSTSWACVNAADSNAPVASGTGITGSFSFPTPATAAGVDVVCTFTNVPRTATIAVTEALGSVRAAVGDQFTDAVRSTSATGTVLNATTNSTTTGAGSTVIAGSGTTGATTVSTVSTPTYFITGAMAAGSPSPASRYASTITCTDANNLQTGLPTAATFTGSLAITPVSGAAIGCIITNSAQQPTLQLSTALGSGRFGAGDQFGVAIHTGSPTGPVINATTNSTTAGTGAAVTAGSGTTGSLTATTGTTYYLTQAPSANAARYASTLTCTDANGFQTGLPTGAVFTGSVAITPVAGSAISCLVTTALAPVALTVVKSNPGSLTVGAQSSYLITATNNGGATGTATIADRLPVGVAYDSASGPGWAACQVTGTVSAGQLVTCTSGAISGGGASALTIVVIPTAAAAGSSVVNRATVDLSGGANPADPSTCTATGTPTGCAVTPGLVVASGISLTLSKTNPVGGLAVGSDAAYSLTVTNSGTGPAATATVRDVLPANLTYVSASSNAACTPAGQVVTCIVTGPIAGSGGTVTFTITVVPTVPADGTVLANAATVDPTGGSSPVDPTTCTANGVPSAGCTVTAAITVGNGILLSLTKTNPQSLTVGVAANYDFVVTNTGSALAGSATVVDHLPVGLTFVTTSSNAACSAVGQVLSCTIAGPIAASGGTAAFTIGVLPTPAADATSVINRAAVDATGGTTPVDPATCTATGAPNSGCAVTPALLVTEGVNLTLSKVNPVSLSVGIASDYTLTVANVGTSAAAEATVADALPQGIAYVSAAGATCVPAGQLITCTVSGPIAVNSQVSFTIRVMPLTAAAGASVVNRAAVDPTGGSDPADPSTCVTTNNPTGCAVTAALTVLTVASVLAFTGTTISLGIGGVAVVLILGGLALFFFRRRRISQE
jgi:uncharacterized repeat protein (TIGR01451 family)